MCFSLLTINKLLNPMKYINYLFQIGLLLLLSVQYSFADEKPVTVGIKLSEPWVMYDEKQPIEQRKPTGFSIDLWNAINEKLGRKTEWVYADTVPQMIDMTAAKKVDASISAITVTSAREEKVDFSNSMYELGLQILVPSDNTPNPWLVALEEIAKLFTWPVILIIITLVLVFAHVRWLVDRVGSDEPSFAPTYFKGITDAGWWAWTMFITWDTPQRKGLARVVDLTWFLIGFLCLGILSSVITAALTSQNINGSIKGVKDLMDKKVVAVETDAPIEYLKKIGITPIPVKNLVEGIQKVSNKEADALVHDGPRLVYLANQFNTKAPRKKQVLVLPNSFNPQTYAIAFPQNSELREKVNYALMELREAKGSEESVYEGLRKKWLTNKE